MPYKNTVEAVYTYLNEIGDVISNYTETNNLSAIDIDLALDKLRRTYDLMLELKKESQNQPITSTKTSITQPQPTRSDKDIEKVKQNIIAESKPKETAPTEEMVEFEEQEAPMKQPVEDIKANTNVQAETPVEEKQTSKKVQNILSDKFSNEPSLNDELSKNSSKTDLASHLTSKPIADLNSALALNEKFELINNLFGGDKQIFEHTLNILNMAGNFNEAYNYLRSNFSWDLDDIYVQKLLDLIRRKLITNKDER